MSTNDNKAVVRRFYEELWNEWRLDVAAEILADDVRFRGSLGQTTVGRDELLGYVETVRRAFPASSREIASSCCPNAALCPTAS